jgi:putative membrane protein
MWRLALLLACVIVNACVPEQSAHPRPRAEAPTSATLASQDRDFLERAAEGNSGEVAMGRLAEKNGASAVVIEYGRMMVADHGAAQTRLTAIAIERRVNLPTSLGEHQAGFDRLADLKGPDFDEEFIRVMRENHQQAVLLYQSEASGGVDPLLVQYAASTLPTIQMHLDHAKGMTVQ